jgi:ERF superfamily
MTITDTTTTVPPVVAALNAVMADVREVGKHSRNESQGFNFRGIDAVVNAVGPALRKHGVVVVPRVVNYDYGTVEVGQRRTPMAHVRVTVDYVFYGPAGDWITATSIGEAMDSGDKATAKAMSVAFRTALLQALCLPTDDPDPDHDVYERSPAKPEATDVEFAALRDSMRATMSLQALAEIGKLAAGYTLTDEQAAELRATYTESAAAIKAATEAPTGQQAALLDEAPASE